MANGYTVHILGSACKTTTEEADWRARSGFTYQNEGNCHKVLKIETEKTFEFLNEHYLST